ncbi:putative AC transposase [Fusarium oxysporum f. sp. rapae]|uniref:Putative AC transposase n=1 Tax=Fusarium oxysporum f. sp. rapae TaxID=485398 RepID=A0A8J5TMD6_FUSOX|nr:putative AC transposase [Fusarium oxysporum f. sp. rapae]
MPDKESIAGTSSSSSFETTQSVAGNSALSNLRRTRSVASQLATVRPEHLDVAQPSSLPSLYIDGLRYVLEDWIHKKRRRSLSWILRYGKYVIRLSDDGTAGGRYWVCGLCDARNQVKILEAKATTSPIYHLNNDHHIYKPSTAHDNGPDSEPESSNRTSPAPSSSVSVLDMQKRAAKRRPLIVESRADIFKRLLLGWITDANIPLHGVEHKLFRQLLAFLDDEFVVEVLPTSGNTVRRWILQEFEEHTRMLKDEMNKALSKVHTSFDMWTSPNGIAILSVIAYYVDIAGTPQVRLISLEKLSGSHGGENQAILMAKVIRKYGLEKKIGFFTADNADPCDTCVRALLKMFNPRASPTGLQGLEGERRIRCVGHILNLSAKAFLEGDSSDIFDSHIAEKDQKKERELLREWRKRGPIGKLHNLVYWIRRNPQRRELFLSITSGKVDQSIMAELGVWFVDDTLKGLMVKVDNDTRWNSVYLMVHRALRLRDIIDVFCKLSLLDPKEEKRVSAEDVLSCEDWVVLAEIIEILQPYLTYTKHFEGRAPRFAEVIPTMYLLKDHLSEMRQRYSSNLIPAPYRAPRITLEEPVLDCIIVAAPTDGREREQQGGLQQDTGVSTWGIYSTMESTTSGEPSSPLYQAEISVQFEDKDLDPEPFELSDDGLHFIQHSIKYAMSKLDKYRNLMERSVVYWAAMILHPGYGIGFLQLRLPNQVDSILRDFRDYFDRHYAQGNQAPVSPDSAPAFHGSKLLLRTANFPKKARKEAPDEINLYLQMNAGPVPERCLVAGDFNARHHSWQTGQATNRGQEIADWVLEHELSLLNTLDIPTNPYGNTIDLAFTNLPLAEATVEDHLATSSDHFTLSLTFPEIRSTPTQSAKIRVTTEDEVKRFVEIVELGATEIPVTDSTPKELDELASSLVNLLTSAVKAAGRPARKGGRPAPWWTEECADAAAAFQAVRRTYPLGFNQDVQTAKRDFHRVVRRAKRKYWRDLIDSFSSSSAVFKAVRWLKSPGAFQPPPLQVDNVVYETQMDRGNALRQATLERRTAEDDITNPWMPVTPRRPIPFPSEISMEEVQYATLSTGNTSPGSDNITVKLLEAVWHIIGTHVRRLFERCLTTGHHPKPFKEAEVVFFILRSSAR